MGQLIDNKIIVGENSYAIDKKLCIKFDKMCERVTQKNPKLDCFLINEGAEGIGKTNSSIIEAYYFKLKTGRDIHLFFKLKPVMDFAQKTENKIIIWDEPSLDSLSTDQITALNKDMQRLFMTIRKKRHIIIVNYTKFWKFPEYMIVDRAIGLIHMYSSSKEHGKFSYIRKKKLEKLWNDMKSKRQRNYNKYKSFRGGFPLFMDFEFDNLGIFVNEISNATLETYEKLKDEAILLIGIKKSKKYLKIETELKKLKGQMSEIYKKDINTQSDLAKFLNIHRRTLREWVRYAEIE